MDGGGGDMYQGPHSYSGVFVSGVVLSHQQHRNRPVAAHECGCGWSVMQKAREWVDGGGLDVGWAPTQLSRLNAY